MLPESITDMAQIESTSNGPRGFQNQTVIFAFFPVFDLVGRSIGLKIYTDLAEQKKVEKLTFTAETYAVAPALL